VSSSVPRPTERALFVFRIAILIGCTSALAALAWLPPRAVTRTVLGGHAEHLIAYLGTAIVIGLTYPRRPRLAVQCVLLIAYAAILEAGQMYAPDRHASLLDFAFSSAGVVMGVLFLWIARRRFTASKPRLRAEPARLSHQDRKTT
jgi:VanZ family protein